MAKYDKTDLALSSDGDLVIEKGDFKVARKQEYINQSIYNRVRSNDPDWYDYTGREICANLEDLRGKPNSVETATEGARRISNCITKHGLVDVDDLYIEPTPMSKAEIVFFVFVNLPYNATPIGFEILMNLDSGAKIRGV